METTNIIAIETLMIEMLIIISIIAIVVQRIQLPYTVALVLSGLVLAVLPSPFEDLTLTTELIVFLILPPLVFEAAFHLDISELKDNLVLIVILAIVGVLISTLVVGGIVALAGVPLMVALVFGALISATDPVAVIAVFRELGVPRKLSYIVEGESLLNDGVAIVVFTIVLGAAASGHFDLTQGLADFLLVTGGGILVGAVIGVVANAVFLRIDNYLIETTLSTVVAYGAFVLAERFHISGVIAVVTAGLLVGNYGSQRSMSPSTRIVIENFWEYVAFIANSFVFLLIGLTIDLPLLLNNLGYIVVGIAAVLIGRAIAVYGLGWIIDRPRGRLTMTYRHVLFWGGLRGAIALALALSLPALPDDWRNSLLAMTFGVVLFTLLIQSTTIKGLLDRLGLILVQPQRRQYEVVRARMYALQAAQDQLQRSYQAGVLTEKIWQALSSEYSATTADLSAQIQTLYTDDVWLQSEEMLAARAEGLRSQRTALQTLVRRGMLSEHSYQTLATQLDVDMEQLTGHHD
ncbi:MAG: Na+/H+ antiporter [Caldilineales bacterium]